MKPQLRLEGGLVVAAHLFVSRSKGRLLGRSTGEVPRRRFARLEAQTIRDGLLHRPVGGDRRDGELDAVCGGLAQEQHERLSIVPASDYLGLGAGSDRRSRWRRYEYRCSIGVGERLVEVRIGQPFCSVEVVA